MPARRKDEYWRELVRQTAAEHESWGPGRVSAAIVRAAADARGDVSDSPSDRTIGRWLREFRALSEREKLGYRAYSWPEAMERGALPWEASRPLSELMHFLADKLPHDQLTIRRAQWFWRVTLAAPHEPITERNYAAHMLAVADAMPDDSIRRCVEAALRDGDLATVRSVYEGHNGRRMEEPE